MAMTSLTYKDMQEAVNSGRLLIATGKEIITGTTPKNNIHHSHILKMPQGGVTGKFCFRFPPLMCSNITKQIPKDSKFATYFTYVDIYGSWPKGQNRGEDPVGDELFDFLTSIENSYKESLKKDEETKNMIINFTDQEPIVRGTKKIVTDMDDVMNSVINYPVFRDGHAQAKQRDMSKSPNFKVKLWEVKLTADLRGKLREDSLLVNVDPKSDPHLRDGDPAKYLQLMYTKIYDMRKNPMSDDFIKTERALNEFLYSAGEAASGTKLPFRMLAGITVLAPTWYWGSKDPAALQFKASIIEVYNKIVPKRADERTTSQKLSVYAEVMACRDSYGIKEDDEDDEDAQIFDFPMDHTDTDTCGYGGNNNNNNNTATTNNNNNENSKGPSSASPMLRQPNPSASVSVRPKTNPVVVYSSTKKQSPPRIAHDHEHDDLFDDDHHHHHSDKESNEREEKQQRELDEPSEDYYHDQQQQQQREGSEESNVRDGYRGYKDQGIEDVEELRDIEPEDSSSRGKKRKHSRVEGGGGGNHGHREKSTGAPSKKAKH